MHVYGQKATVSNLDIKDEVIGSHPPVEGLDQPFLIKELLERPAGNECIDGIGFTRQAIDTQGLKVWKTNRQRPNACHVWKRLIQVERSEHVGVPRVGKHINAAILQGLCYVDRGVELGHEPWLTIFLDGGCLNHIKAILMDGPQYLGIIIENKPPCLVSLALSH